MTSNSIIFKKWNSNWCTRYWKFAHHFCHYVIMVLKNIYWKDKDLRRFTPLHNNPSNGVQHFVWNCQNKQLYEESSLYQFGWFHHWIFWVERQVFPTKNHPSSNEKMEKKNAESRWNIFLISDFLHYVECNALGAKTSGDAYYWEFPSPRPSITLRKAPAKVYFIIYLPVILRKRKKKKRAIEFQKKKTIVTFQKAECPTEWAFHFLKCPIIFGG